MSLNLAQAIQHYVSLPVYLWQVRSFLCALRFPPPIKLTSKKFVESGPYVSNRVPLKLFYVFFLLFRTLGFIRNVCRSQKGYDRLRCVMVSAVLVMTASEV
jgi:hypothetical protein